MALHGFRAVDFTKMKKTLLITILCCFGFFSVVLASTDIKIRKDTDTFVKTSAQLFAKNEIVDVRAALQLTDIEIIKLKYDFTDRQKEVLGKVLKNEEIQANELDEARSVFVKMIIPILKEATVNGSATIQGDSDLAVLFGLRGEKLTGQEKIKLMALRNLKSL